MSKFIGRRLSIGFGKEASTQRGTAVAISFWTPKMDVAIDDKLNQVINEASVGTISDSENVEITSKYSQGSLTGRLEQTAHGLILASIFGTEASTAVTGDATVYDHTFTVAESAQHPSLSIGVSEPNATGAASKVYTLGMIDTYDIDVEVGKYPTYKIGFKANASTTATLTPSYSVETAFLPQDGVVKFATNLAGLGAASAIVVKKVTLSIKQNVEDDIVVGSVTPADRLNKQFAVDGTVELLYNDRTYIDTNFTPGLVQAMRIQLVNSDVTIGTSSKPTITFDLAKVYLQDVARKITNNDIVSQTLKFKAVYSLGDTSMISCFLRNLQSTTY
jgi:hypothetical protein